jgi:polar amino acid transport system substrate-binding protein
MDTRSQPWAYVPGLDYSREDWTKAPLIQPAQIARLEGVDIDLMNALAKHLKASFVVVPHAWATIEEGLLAKRYDIILNAWAPSDQTPKGIVASAPYNEWGLLLAVRSDQEGIQSYRDLAGRRVGHFKDRVVSRGLQSLATSVLVPVEDSDELFDRLAAGEFDAVVEDSTYVLWRTSRDARFRVVGERLNRYGYHLGLRREDTALLERVQAAVQALQASGEVERIRARWGGR